MSSMQKLFIFGRVLALQTSLLLLVAVSSSAWGDDNFALALGAHDTLVIFGPKGDKVAELSVPAISQPITVGATSFQVSYGRDANDLLTAILTPSATQPQPLHFNVLNKNVETDQQAVVTLTFPAGRKRVTVDAGYVGSVQVNSHTMRHHVLTADDYGAPQPAYRMTPATDSRSAANIQPERSSSKHVQLQDSTETSSLLASDAPASLRDPEGSSPSSPLPSSHVAEKDPSTKLFWAEPVTPLHGPPPQVASDQMMLVEVHGPVTIKAPDGSTSTGTNGTIVPSGATVSTAEDASAAVFMGGINSARLLPQSEASVTQNLDGTVRKTRIDLHKGSVFSRVGRRTGETEDYKVHTPQGVAAAHGTAFDTSIVTSGGTTFTLCFVENGVVKLTDASGAHSFTITPESGDQIAFASTPTVSLADAKQILLDILNLLQQFNTKLQAIALALLTDPDSVPPKDVDYYNHNKNEVTDATQLYDAITDQVTTMDSGNGQGPGSGGGNPDDGVTAPPNVGPPDPLAPPPPGVLNNDINNVSPM